MINAAIKREKERLEKKSIKLGIDALCTLIVLQERDKRLKAECTPTWDKLKTNQGN